MKQHIAKLLVFLMLMTTMIVPADLSFAESGNENTTQTEEPNDPQEKTDLTQETPAKATDDEKIVENESSPNSSVAKESIIAAENDQLEETVTERMEFLYIESKELVAPGTQNIVVSWKEAIDDIQNMVLVYENEQGKTFTLKESRRNDESIVFTKDFAASEAGTYKIKGVKYFIGNEEKYFNFDDVEIAASFKVVKGQTIEDDAIAKVEVESDGTVDKKEVNGEIKDAVTSTDAAPKAQTKARRAKSSNIVVVLDPGHGGSDSGATRGSVYEKNINFKVAQYCKAELEQYCGVTVYMTRTGDTNPSLQERAQIAANYGANILVSIHQNSGSSSAYGAEVYYPNRNYKPAIGDSGKAVADSIQKELVSLGLSDRGTKIRNTANGSTYADGSYSDYYGIIRNSKNLGIPAIIVEHAFLSNASDYNNFLSSDSKLQKLGIADATGIANAFGLRKGTWESTAEGKKYKYTDGSYATGYINIGGYYYYFDDEGIMQTGYQKINGKPYKFYMDPGYGYSEGWTTIKDGDKVYCWGNGKLATGRVAIKGKIYTFDEDGVLLDKYDKWENSEKGKKYKYADGSYAIGYVNIGGYYYYFNDDGVMQTGYQKINGKPYKFYIDPGYGYSAGWTTIKDGDKAYCLGNGRLVTGKVAIDGKTYTFDEEGILKDVEDFYKISGNSSIDSKDLMQLYNKKSKVYPNYYKNTDAPDLATFCKMYVEEARLESIKPEVAFCQAMLETGWLQYSGSVKIQQFNFAGLGATGGGSSGASFPDVRTGIRAQIQHLKAYASTDVLVNSCVDPRFNLVKRGSALYVEWLGQRENPNGLGWATSPNYGYNILTLIEDLDR